MKYILTSLIDDPNDYKIFYTDEEFYIDIDERYVLGYFDTEKQLANLLMQDNYYYRDSPYFARIDAEKMIDNI